MKYLRYFFISLVIIICYCTPEVETKTEEPVNVIFDTDMGSDCDDAGALALLHRYADLGEANIIGCIYSSGKVPYGAGIIQAINLYYGRPFIPVGANYDDEVGDPADKMQAEKLVRDTAAFKNTIIHNTDAMEQTDLNRKLLSTAEDQSIVYITVGHTKGLYDLLVSTADKNSALNGHDLIRKKVKKWVALGALQADNPEGHFVKDWNFFFNNTAPYTEYLINTIPVPIYYVSGGGDVMTGKSLKTTPNGNIVRTAYRDWLWNYENKTLDDQRPSWDLVTVYYAIEGTGDFFEHPVRGRLEFNAQNGCRWISVDQNNQQFYVRQKTGTNKNFAAYLNKMISETPRLNTIEK